MPKQVTTYISPEIREKYTPTPTAPINTFTMELLSKDSLSSLQKTAKAKNLLRKDNEYDILRDKNNKDVFVLQKETNNNIFELSIKGCNIDEKNPDITNLPINDHILFNKNVFLQNPKKYNLILRLIDLGKLAVKI